MPGARFVSPCLGECMRFLVTCLLLSLACVTGVFAAGRAGGGSGAAPVAPHRASPDYATDKDRAFYASLCAQVDAAFDSSRGGWVGRDGAPSEAAIELALLHGREGDALAMADRKSTRLNSSHPRLSRMPSSA